LVHRDPKVIKEQLVAKVPKGSKVHRAL
jgi:hypothetical protein